MNEQTTARERSTIPGLFTSIDVALGRRRSVMTDAAKKALDVLLSIAEDEDEGRLPNGVPAVIEAGPDG